MPITHTTVDTIRHVNFSTFRFLRTYIAILLKY